MDELLLIVPQKSCQRGIEESSSPQISNAITLKLIRNILNLISMDKLKDEFREAGIFSFRESVSYSDNAIVSKQVIKKPAGNLTLFAFDKGQELSEHTAPFDALVQVLEGEVRIRIDKKEHNLKEGFSIIMPANVPHALFAKEKFKMLLTMIKA